MDNDVKDKIYLITIFSLIFLILTIISFFSGLDAKVHDYFFPVNQNILTLIMSYITLIGGREGIMIISLIVLISFLMKKKYDFSLFYLISVSGATIVNYELKNLFQRVRPEIYGTEFSFPSGHAMASTVAFGTLALYFWPKNKKISISLLIIPLLVGFSRIYLDVHWVSDVFGGFFFGAIWLAITFYLFYGWKK